MNALLPVAQAKAKIAPVRVYGVSPLWKTAYILMGAAMAILSSYGVWFFLLDDAGPRGVGKSVLVTLCGMAMVLGCFLVMHAFTYRFFFGLTEIGSSGFLFSRHMYRQDIRGRRTQKVQGMSIIRLFPARRGVKTFTLLQDLAGDRAYDNWLASVPDLDEQDDRAAAQEILGNPQFGATVEGRAKRLQWAQAIGGAANGAASVLCIWFLSFPQPYGFLAAAMALTPPTAFAMFVASKGLFSLDDVPKTGKGGHPTVAVFFLLPAILLAGRGVTDWDIVDWKLALILGGVFGLALSAAAIWVAGATLRNSTGKMTGKKRFTWLAIGLAVTLWSIGVVIQGNCLLDRTSATAYEAVVIGKHQNAGKYKTRYFKLDPWGPVTEAEDVTVRNQDLYDRITPGATVCVVMHSGAFRMRWTEVWGCR
jgi:hypothetical protein